jgi:tetratricopeptide (TPR) repeat protein
VRSLAFLLLAGCAAPEPVYPERRVDAPRAPMSVDQARKIVASSIQGGYDGMYDKNVVKNLRVSRQRAAFVFAGDASYDCVMRFADANRLGVRQRGDRYGVRANGKPLGLSSATATTAETMRHGLEDFLLPAFDLEDDALLFVDALLTLKTAPDTEEADFAAFSARVKEPRAAMSEEVRLSKALAEDAFKRKDFAAALEAYLDALGKHPLWPEGHYNAALLAAEVEDYELAARHMRRYIALSPDAKDVAAAEEKYLLWRHKAKP